jgi:uncharacterized protein YdeI (YjbR/CyaY-like superfamily)
MRYRVCMPPRFFTSQAAFRAWLRAHAAKESELLIGFVKTEAIKRDPSLPALTYKQALDEALCYGWIDGVRKNVDPERYSIRFTPRKAKSNWSAINIARVGELTRLRLMKPAGTAAFAQHGESQTRRYSYENRPRTLPPEFEKAFKANKPAWAFFQAQTPGYQRTVIFWLTDAAKEETRLKRLSTLIDDCAHERWIKGFISPRPKPVGAAKASGTAKAAGTAKASGTSKAPGAAKTSGAGKAPRANPDRATRRASPAGRG